MKKLLILCGILSGMLMFSTGANTASAHDWHGGYGRGYYGGGHYGGGHYGGGYHRPYGYSGHYHSYRPSYGYGYRNYGYRPYYGGYGYGGSGVYIGTPYFQFGFRR